MLTPQFQTSIAQTWNGELFDVMLALHARRSADSIARWAQAKGVQDDAMGLGVVLTGTDLYRDIQTDALAPAMRRKARVIFQSAAALEAVTKPIDHLHVVMVGHLRDEKSPQTLFEAARLLKGRADIVIDHIGDALDPALGAQASACMQECPNYRWLGGLPHEAALSAMGQAHVLVHTSRMEGGAHVILEAVCSGTPVLASRIPGNVGMLGTDYAGYFEHGDAHALAELLLRCRAQLGQPSGLHNQLWAQCALRVPLFSPATEQAAVVALAKDLLHADH